MFRHKRDSSATNLNNLYPELLEIFMLIVGFARGQSIVSFIFSIPVSFPGIAIFNA